MNSNGYEYAKPNKWGCICKKQYIHPMLKNSFHKLEYFIKRYSHYTHTICEKSLEYESSAHLSYQKRQKIILPEKLNKIKTPNRILL